MRSLKLPGSFVYEKARPAPNFIWHCPETTHRSFAASLAAQWRTSLRSVHWAKQVAGGVVKWGCVLSSFLIFVYKEGGREANLCCWWQVCAFCLNGRESQFRMKQRHGFSHTDDYCVVGDFIAVKVACQ